LASLDASMMDQIEAILESYLSFDFQEKEPLLEDVSVKNWMSRVLTLFRNSASFQQAKAIIEPLSNEYSSSLNFNDKVPYSSLLLFYVSYKWGHYSDAAKYAKDAIDEFAQRGMTQNQIISLWLRALAFEEDEQIEDAQDDIKIALKLIEKKLSDCKRFIRMKAKQTKCEQIQKELLIANNRLGK
jgi:hypothetical protein